MRTVKTPAPLGRAVAAFACAHRGLSADVPENTIAAFQAAAKAGFRAVEMDLRTTADHEVVVLHDAGLEGTTDGNGRVADMTYDDVRRHPTKAGPVPRLDDLLASMREWRGLWNLEIKAESATEPAIQLLHHHHAVGRAQISSMIPGPLEVARALDPDLVRALIVPGPVGLEAQALARELECAWINADHEDLDAATVQRLRRGGFRVAAWTVNDPARARQLATWGVECIITDGMPVLHALASDAAARPHF